MGCCSPSHVATAIATPSTPSDLQEPVIGRLPFQNAADKHKGKGWGAGNIKATGNRQSTEPKKGQFQIQLEGQWADYGKEEDRILKRAFLVGHLHVKFSLRGQLYEFSFEKMTQKNVLSGRERKIRPPPFMRLPEAPLLPPGCVIVIPVLPGAAGRTIEIQDPNNPGHKVKVAVPAGAKLGAQMAVPVPEKGESVEAVSRRQQSHSTGCKVATGLAAGGALAVGGVILGDHVTGGAVSDWATTAPESVAACAIGDAGGWAGGAAADVAAWAPGAAGAAGEWAGGATEHAGEWAAGAAAGVAVWAPVAAADTGDWSAGAARDAGEFVMSLF